MAQRRYYSEDEMAERQPLGGSGPSPHHRQYQQPSHYQQEPYNSPSSQSRSGGHPDSSFDRLRSQRRYNPEAANGGRGIGAYAAGTTPNGYSDSASPLRSSPQRDPDVRPWGQRTSYPPPVQQRPSPQSTITPGADNFSDVAAGGMAGIALTVAEQNARESGLNAIHNPHPYNQQGQGQGLLPRGDYYPGDRSSQSSLQGLGAAAIGSGYATPGQRTPSRLGAGDIYRDDPYQNLSRHQDSSLGVVNPHEIADDGDDGLEYGRRGPRTSMLSIGSSHRTAAAGGAVGGGVLGGLVGRNGSGSVSNQYAPVNNSVAGDAASGGSVSGGGGGGGGGGVYNVGLASAGEKPWQAGAAAKKSKTKKWKIALITVVAIAIIAGIVLGILFGVVYTKKDGGGGGSSGSTGGGGISAADDTQANGDLNADSSEIKALMNNPDLRKVFVGMDYTPLNTQYPECVHDPPSQNNVTRDLAVLSQLSNVVRLYGTDCNQTQMLIHAVDRLKLQDSVKIWLGVWQDQNETTNARQLAQMWDILDQYGESYFKGIIVANEILFREQMTITSLGALLEEVRTNLTARGMSLPVATSDLGDKWTSALAGQSDAIMANIHPFFAGTKASEGADWTMYFWGNKTSTFLKKDKRMNIISETGWPSQGGMACGNEFQTDCPDKAVAGLDEMNVFMEDWVCAALDKGTEYFWFEAFDEPWKIRFNTKGKAWEDHWGLMTVDRQLKKGLTIPDCGGKRAPSN
ncbi:glycoside hydrolase [Chaetomidium leptoderma]|uniref:glucan endo-1,3-beta-D-glucosidase n=1 Tax=Chaetomidium leptoderma TaxID=669021 RepID=A0AAN6VDN1_9PEZI|nr:glycoside hydrolase [Chaetomidium leptoderma]